MKREQRNPKIPALVAWELWFRSGYLQVASEDNSVLRHRAVEGNSPVTLPTDSGNSASDSSRIAWDCSTNREVYSS